MPTLVGKGTSNPKRNPSYIRFPHSLKVPEETPHTLPPEYPKLISIIKVSWIKKFFQSDWYRKLKKSPKIIKTKISNYQDLQSDIKDLSKWTLQIIKGKLNDDDDDDNEEDDESDDESSYDHEENEDGNYNDWDKDPEYFKSYASTQFQIDQFIDYLVEEHGFQMEDLSELYDADYNDLDSIVDEIYHNHEDEIYVDITEPDFGNNANNLLVSYLALIVCIVSFMVF